MNNNDTSTSRSRPQTRMDRRDVLKGLGAVGAIGTVGYGVSELGNASGRSGDETPGAVANPNDEPPTAGPDDEPTVDDEPQNPDARPRYADQYANVVNVVQAGADPKGNAPINDVVEKHGGTNTLLSFPSGTYRVDPLLLEGQENVAIASASADGDRPTWVAQRGVCKDQPYLRFEGVSNFLIDGIDFDFQKPGAGGGFRILADGDATIQNASITGSCARQIAAFRIDVLDPKGTGLVRNLRADHVTKRKLTGLFVGQDHAGEVTFENCHVTGYSDNGLYASVPGLDDGGNGPVHVVGGTYANNNIANVRLGTTGASARNVDIRVEKIPKGYQPNARGIRFRDRRNILVEDCRVHFGKDVKHSFGAIVFHGDSEGGTVRNTHVHVDSPNVPSIRAFAPNQPDNDPPVFENVTITGDATNDYAARIYNRDGTTFQNCTIKQRGDRRGGIRLKDASGCSVVDSYIEVDHSPIVARGASILVQNTTIVTPQGARHVDSAILENGILSPT